MEIRLKGDVPLVATHSTSQNSTSYDIKGYDKFAPARAVDNDGLPSCGGQQEEDAEGAGATLTLRSTQPHTQVSRAHQAQSPKGSGQSFLKDCTPDSQMTSEKV